MICRPLIEALPQRVTSKKNVAPRVHPGKGRAARTVALHRSLHRVELKEKSIQSQGNVRGAVCRVLFNTMVSRMAPVVLTNSLAAQTTQLTCGKTSTVITNQVHRVVLAPWEFFSKRSIFCGKTIQCWAERVQTCLSILIQLGSSKVPPVTMRQPGNFSRLNMTVVAHRLQKCSRNQRLLSSERCSYVVSPSPADSIFCSSKKA